MKKSQIKMGETIAVLIVFFMLIMVGVIFYAKFKQGSIERKQEEMDILNTIEIAIKISLLPELRHTEDGIESGKIDLLKLKSLNYLIEHELTRNPYYDLFYTSEIVVEQVYPTEYTWVLYNYSGGKTSIQPAYLPITIHDVLSQNDNFGYIRVGVYV